ncbi:uncharacterized protein EI97DRAFT_467385 [Westerdykella ornata]|uniref:Chitin-binding type-3 domain-containing protein n=1 Tax=Westerdykella ornata TaxID=318751 RepID=A0A6A6JIU9_WESOR|nr:uncharacterized protein EI97DRAFT_467385 [Westerdykella ornata]KAF2276155.1 hypothetical protein EI97DRAFT_467385 [Westerdykella ornata]
MTEPLFRFLVLRPPVAQNPDAPSISLSQASDFQKTLSAALKSNDPRGQSEAAARAFVASDAFVGQPGLTDFQRKLAQLGSLLDEASFGGTLSLRSVVAAIKKAFGKEPGDVIKSNEYKTLLANLRDSVTAIKFVQEEHSRPIEALANQIRDLELIAKAASLSSENTVVEAEGSSAVSGEVRSRTASDGHPAQWQPQTVYKIGDQVIYDNVTYVCIQAHTSLVGWEPPMTPALWVRVIKDGPGTPSTPDTSLLQYRRRSLLLPFGTDMKSVIAGGDDSDPRKDAEEREKLAKSLLEDHENLSKAINELIAIDPKNFQALEQKSHKGVQVQDQYTSIHVLARQLELQSSLRDLNVDQFKAAAGRSGSGGGDGGNGPKISAAAAAAATQLDPLQLQDIGGAVSALGLTRELLSTPTGLTSKRRFDPKAASALALKLKTNTPLTEGTKSLLKAKGIDVGAIPLPEIVKGLRDDMRDKISSLKLLAPDFEEVTVTRVGNALVTTKTPVRSRLGSLLTGKNFGNILSALPVLPPDGRIPHTKGKATIAGMGDLLVVKQQLVGYDGADIAHIENVLKGESKDRQHTSTSRTESSTFVETEISTTDDHELSSTSRFEMSKESANTIKEDQSLKAGIQVSAKYGPFVEVSASVEGATSRSKEEVNKSASKFSQDVTERSAKKITERTLSRQTLTTTSEIVEKNNHGINNTSGTTNVSGVYQWVNKVYEAQVFNYGLRTMFDFMVPEPAAFLIDMMSDTANKALTLEKPPPFTLTPSQIDSGSYQYWVLKYQATDVVPPPEDYITKSDQVSKGGGDSKTNYWHSATMSLESGYEAVYGTVTCLWNQWADDCNADVFLGTATHRFVDDGQWVWNTPLSNQKGSIAWGFETYRFTDAVLSVEVLCKVTPRAVDVWRADTHAKLLNAYNARMQEYEEKLSTLKLQTGIAIEGKNPAANLVAIKQELKKNCISILTAQHYDLFNSISTSSLGLAQINLDEAEAEGSYVRFFEHAFEWDQIMYVTYPYFWGRKTKWTMRLAFDDPDPVFDEFLKSGFCRVVIPARPGFEGAIDHFLKFGILWNGGSLPTISCPLFVPIADEIAERSQRPGGGVPQGEPWVVKLPTSLVKLRQDDKLPKWKKTSDGVWVPDE